MDVMDDPKNIKKAIIRKRNKRDFIIRKMLEDKERENERASEQEELAMESFKDHYAVPSVHGDDPQARIAQYRNMITGKKRASRERWNRFAGTESGGGRGL